MQYDMQYVPFLLQGALKLAPFYHALFKISKKHTKIYIYIFLSQLINMN